MPVFIYEPDAFKKICLVEGPDYAENQKDFGICGFDAFKKRWEEAIKQNPALKETEGCYAISVDSNSAIYGWGGYNRYIVFYSGEILFSSNHAINEAALKLAKEVGFRTI
ncbi:MAG: hypothetical protein HY764_00970 [Candidatus Portnoybacteria bacterium]|nr:hypothetical protein [Candidatus Portnoybacteria bacterium]